MSGYRGLGFDPAPGDPDAVGAAAAEFVAAAEALGLVGPAVRGAREAVGGWQGAAAEGFLGRLGAVPSDVEERAGRLRAAAEVLAGWGETLAVNRRAAGDLDARARALRGRISAAEDDVHAARNGVDLAATPAAAAAAGMAHAGAESALAQVETQLAEVVRAARVLEADHQRAAGAVAEALDALRDEPVAPVSAVGSLGSVLDGVSRGTAALARLFSGGGGGAGVPRGAAGVVAGVLVPAQVSSESIVVEEPGAGRR